MAACDIVACFHDWAGEARVVAALLCGFTEPSRSERGCLFYELHREGRDYDSFVAANFYKLEPLLAGPSVITQLERLS